MDELKINISSVLVPSRDGVQSRSFLSEYKSLTGLEIKPEDYGFNSLLELMKGIPDTVYIINAGPGNYIFKAKENSMTAHISQMVTRQKVKSNKKKRGGGRFGQNKSRSTQSNNWGSNHSKSRAVENPISRKPTENIHNNHQIFQNDNRDNCSANGQFSQSGQRNGAGNGQDCRDLRNNLRNANSSQPQHGLFFQDVSPVLSFENYSINAKGSAKSRLGNVRQKEVSSNQSQSSSVNHSNFRSDYVCYRGDVVSRQRTVETFNQIPDLFSNLQLSLPEAFDQLEISIDNVKAQPIASSSRTRRIRLKQESTQKITRCVQNDNYGLLKETEPASPSWSDECSPSLNRSSILSLRGNSTNSITPVESNRSIQNLNSQTTQKQFQHNAITVKPKLTPSEMIPKNVFMMNIKTQEALTSSHNSCILSFGESPSNFYLVKLDLGEMKQRIDSKIEKIVTFYGSELEKTYLFSSTSSQNRIFPSEFVIVKHPQTAKWCRAQKTCDNKLFLIDSGETLHENATCFRMPESLHDIAPMAYKCQLNLFPKLYTWSQEACDVFVGEIQLCPLLVAVVDTSPDVYTVEIVTDEGEDISNLLCALNYATRQLQTRRIRQCKAMWQSLPDVSSAIEVIVVAIVSPCVVYFNLTSCHDQYKELIYEIEQCAAQEFNSRSVVQCPKLNEFYVCRDSDNEYFRVKVVSVDESGTSIEVEYVDFGEVSVMPPSSLLYPMKASFFDLPFQAIKVQLKDFQTVPMSRISVTLNLLRKQFCIQVVDDETDSDSWSGKGDTRESSLPLVELFDSNGNSVTPEQSSSVKVENQVSSDSNWLNALEMKINSDVEYLTKIQNLISIPEPGQIYIAFNPILKRFCRALFESEDESCFIVNFFDYENNVMKIPKWLINGAPFVPQPSGNNGFF